MQVLSVKCRKCRFLLFLHPEITLNNAHAISISQQNINNVLCSTVQEDNLWFLQESNLPSWISDLVDKV